MVLRVGWTIDQHQGFVTNHPVSNHANPSIYKKVYLFTHLHNSTIRAISSCVYTAPEGLLGVVNTSSLGFTSLNRAASSSHFGLNVPFSFSKSCTYTFAYGVCCIYMMY